MHGVHSDSDESMSASENVPFGHLFAYGSADSAGHQAPFGHASGSTVPSPSQ